MTLSAARVEAYLARLGLASPVADAAGLRSLHVAHLRRIPFENLDIHLGVPIVLDIDRIVDKLTIGRRGGFCYELNGGFAALLDALGFEVEMMEARVYGDDGEAGIRYDHLCLAVDAAGTRYLADVGFGACFDEPLRFEPGREQHDPAGTFVIEDRDDGWLDLRWNDRRDYRFDPTPRQFEDFAEACVYQQTSPESHFTQNTVCSLPTERGRVTIAGTTLVQTVDGERTERELAAEELLDAYQRYFGIRLERVPISPR